MTSPLTPEAVAQMVTDREAGTPGPWTAEEKPGQKTAYGTASSIGLWSQHRRDVAYAANPDDEDEADDASWLLGIWGEIGDDDRANARRIARLPDLEAAYLTLAAENATLRASEAAAMERIATIEAALADPIAVHANMLRGTIAMPSFANIKHLYAADFAALTPTADKE